MALPILDGNQSLTNLSTVVSGGAHIPAHTIVSLGSQAITDIANAISGSSVNVLTMPSISVTATVSGGLTDAQLRASPVTIGGSVTASISGTPSVTFGTAVVTGSASILNFPATQTVTFTQITTHGVTIGAGTAQIGSVTASISGTVPVSGTFYQATQPVSIATLPASTVTISSLPSLVAGTAQIGSVTASVSNFPATQTVTFTQIATHGVIIGAGTSQIGSVTASISGTVPVSGTFYQATQPVSIASLPALAAGTNQIGSVTASITSLPSTTVTVSSLPSLAAGTNQIGSVTASISGTVPVSGTFYQATQPVSIASLPSLAAGTNQVGSVTASLNQGGTAVGSANPLQVTLANTGANSTAIKVDGSASTQPISGTITVGRTGTISTYNGSISSANTSQQIVASNSSRKYFAVQNNSDTDMYVGVGYTPTTTIGAYLASGGGSLVFESGFVPTQAINILCTTSGKNFVAWEG